MATVSVSAASTTKTATISYQYGAAAFDPKGIYSQFSSSDLNVQVKGDYTIVSWSSGFDGTHLYMSVAKKNKWIFRGKEVLYVDDEYSSDPTRIRVAENYIFYGNNERLSVRVVNLDDGKTISEKTLQTWEKSLLASHYIYPIKTNDRSGVMYLNGEGKYTIYLAGELSKPLTIADPKDAIKFYINSSLSAVLTTNRDRLVFSTWLGTTMFNIVKKDISYDEKGQAKIYPGSSFYANGKFYSHQSDTKKSSILTFDENFKLLSTTAFKLTPRYLESGAGTTITGGVVRFWGFNNYQNTNSLQVTSLDLSK